MATEVEEFWKDFHSELQKIVGKVLVFEFGVKPGHGWYSFEVLIKEKIGWVRSKKIIDIDCKRDFKNREEYYPLVVTMHAMKEVFIPQVYQATIRLLEKYKDRYADLIKKPVTLKINKNPIEEEIQQQRRIILKIFEEFTTEMRQATKRNLTTESAWTSFLGFSPIDSMTGNQDIIKLVEGRFIGKKTRMGLEIWETGVETQLNIMIYDRTLAEAIKEIFPKYVKKAERVFKQKLKVKYIESYGFFGKSRTA